MKHFCTILLFLLSLGLSAQVQRITQTTYEANSPSVWAKNFDASYGIKPSVLDQLVALYEKEGTDSLARRKKVEKLIREFTLVAPKEQQKQSLSEADRQKLGISDSPAVAEALEWQLYTQGANSPAVYALGNVKIWYGIPKKAFLGIVALLEEKQSQIEDFDKKLREQVEKFEELRAELAARSDNDAVAKRAKQLLEEGNIAEAERILEEDFDRDAKKLAYKAFELAQVKVLALKYSEATPYYQKAASLDEKNSKYLVAYGVHLSKIGRYDEAIIFYQKALAVDNVDFKDQPKKVAILYNNLGMAWLKKGGHDRAITYFEEALSILIQSFGESSPYVAAQYNNLGGAWQDKEEYDRAIACYKKALVIDSIAFGEKHPSVALRLSNLGSAWHAKGEYDRAIMFFERAFKIDSTGFGKNHPAVAREYNNLGGVWLDKVESDRAIAYFEKALAIDSVVFGRNHPKIAALFNNLGSAWQVKGEYDRAIAYYEKCQVILVQFFEPNHPNCIATNQLFSRAANDRGMEFFGEQKYVEALPYFQKALENAEQAEDWPFSLTCLNNVGSMHKRLKQYAESLDALEKGLARAEQVNLAIDEEIKKLPPETLQKPEVQAEIAELKNATLIRRMRYHKAGCLAGLGRKKEADELYQQLLKEAKEANDTRLLEDLKNDGIGN